MTQTVPDPTQSTAGDAGFVVVATSRDASPDLLWAALRKEVAADAPVTGSSGRHAATAVTTRDPESALRATEDAIGTGASRIVVVDRALLSEDRTLDPEQGVTLSAAIGRLRQQHPGVDVQVIGAWGDHRSAAELVGLLRASQPVRDALTDRALGRVFGGDLKASGRFLGALREGLPPDTRLVLRGSAVSGRSYERQTRFDARGPGTSDLDMVALGEAAGRLWVDEARLLGGINSLPLCDGSRWVAPSLDPARVQAQAIVGRPVSVQSMAEWFLQLRAAVQGTPYLLLDTP